jgi:hemerythrin superfamily protein
MGRDVLDLIAEDHEKFRTLFGEMNEAPADQRGDLFRHIVAELARHESAEEALVHPTLRDEVPGGEAHAESVLHEESEAEKQLSELEKMDPASTDFVSRFQQIEREVLTHANHEEREEWPRLREHLDLARRQDMGEAFQKLKDSGPTHPHPMTPQTPGVRAAAGPIAGMFDRARDAVRDAMKS